MEDEFRAEEKTTSPYGIIKQFTNRENQHHSNVVENRHLRELLGHFARELFNVDIKYLKALAQHAPGVRSKAGGDSFGDFRQYVCIVKICK